MVRLAKRQIFDIDTWRIALDLFKARAVNPRVQRSRWLADALVESAPPGGYEPVPGRCAGRRHRMGCLASIPHRLDRRAARAPSHCFGGPGHLRRCLATRAWLVEFRQAVRARVRETGGVVGETMLDALEETPSAEIFVSLGLACRVLFHPEPSGQPRDAAIRFERFHGRRPLAADVGLQWAEAAERVIAERESADGWATRASACGQGGSSTDRAWRRELPACGALVARRRIRAAAGTDGGRNRRRAQAILRRPIGRVRCGVHVLDHRLARVYSARQRRVEMSLRLVRWLQSAFHVEPFHCRRRGGVLPAGCIRQSCTVGAARGGEQPADFGSAYVALLGRVRDTARAGERNLWAPGRVEWRPAAGGRGVPCARGARAGRCRGSPGARPGRRSCW